MASSKTSRTVYPLRPATTYTLLIIAILLIFPWGFFHSIYPLIIVGGALAVLYFTTGSRAERYDAKSVICLLRIFMWYNGSFLTHRAASFVVSEAIRTILVVMAAVFGEKVWWEHEVRVRMEIECIMATLQFPSLTDPEPHQYHLSTSSTSPLLSMYKSLLAICLSVALAIILRSRYPLSPSSTLPTFAIDTTPTKFCKIFLGASITYLTQRIITLELYEANKQPPITSTSTSLLLQIALLEQKLLDIEALHNAPFPPRLTIPKIAINTNSGDEDLNTLDEVDSTPTRYFGAMKKRRNYDEAMLIPVDTRRELVKERRKRAKRAKRARSRQDDDEYDESYERLVRG
ncbi:hypothetical protein DM02DRAFT_731542 [Periconia macrospinosa]|uniref:Uncharacterized protein n=1 Tax=Periconia macrospinosa TaxID=97972 RepID=A0A2V1DFG2_9PLEO|nr:hypothetical protein DM02DRAFT_731542 [Periconia macrospinosa]